HFSDSTGLDAANVSTAYEVAQLLYAAYQTEALRPILATGTHVVQTEIPAAGESETPRIIEHAWRSSNQLLGSGGIVGGKTGYTSEAGQSLAVISATNNRHIIVVVLDAADRFRAARGLHTWVRSAYLWKT
ncbi:MAG: hypothetical protein WD850_02830, partial [Candidatus Spechtbacterales bacterium]